MYRSRSVLNHSAKRLQSILFAHTLADLADCAHEPYALAQRMACISENLPREQVNHKWAGRFQGASVRKSERSLLVKAFPTLQQVLDDPLWGVLGDAGERDADWEREFTEYDPDGALILSYRFTDINAVMEKWCGIPRVEKLVSLLQLLRTRSDAFSLPRLWVHKNFSVYFLIACARKPLSYIAHPLYEHISELAGQEYFEDVELKHWPDDGDSFEYAVDYVRTWISEWLGQRAERTEEQACKRVWQHLKLSKAQRRQRQLMARG